jgi:allantoate deiminase
MAGMVLTQKTTNAARLAEQAIARCRTLASFSEDAGRLRRTFLSPPMRDVHREIGGWLAPLGMRTRIDAVGNLRAIYPGTDSSFPRLLIGSHLDTVPNAGIYDGMLGVVLAVALLEGLEGRRLPYAIEVVGFSEEEGVRFGIPFIGSRTLIGRIDDDLLHKSDAGGITIRKAIEQFGLNPAEIPRDVIDDGICAYLEFHIEQGPVLENLGRPLGVVEAIAGQTRMDFVFTGRANHAGTTPMNLRFDAMAGAAEWIIAVERTAKSVPGLVATVGSVQTRPGVTNVVAGEVRAALDLRHANDDQRTRAIEQLTHAAQEIARIRGLSVSATTRMNQPAVPMSAKLTDHIDHAIRSVGCEPHRMVSGAGHDAMILAEKVPSAMIFLRTPNGVSHDPSESVSVDDVAKAIESGLQLLEQLCSHPLFQPRTLRA